MDTKEGFAADVIMSILLKKAERIRDLLLKNWVGNVCYVDLINMMFH
jgi:hypothetical protein